MGIEHEPSAAQEKSCEITWHGSLLLRASEQIRLLRGGSQQSSTFSILDKLQKQLSALKVDEDWLCAGSKPLPPTAVCLERQSYRAGNVDVATTENLRWDNGFGFSVYRNPDGSILFANRGHLEALSIDGDEQAIKETLHTRSQHSARGRGDIGRLVAHPSGGVVSCRHVTAHDPSRGPSCVPGIELWTRTEDAWTSSSISTVKCVLTFDVMPDGTVVGGGDGDGIFAWNRTSLGTWEVRTLFCDRGIEFIRYAGQGRFLTASRHSGVAMYQENAPRTWETEEICASWAPGRTLVPLPDGTIASVDNRPGSPILVHERGQGRRWRCVSAISLENRSSVVSIQPLPGQQLMIQTESQLLVASRDKNNSWSVRLMYESKDAMACMHIDRAGHITLGVFRLSSFFSALPTAPAHYSVWSGALELSVSEK